MTDQDMKKLVADLLVGTTEIKQAQTETDRQIKQVNKQLGELGNKWGSFTEGMAIPSMSKVLYDDFGLQVVLPNAKARQNGHSLEVDVLAHTNDDRRIVFVVEIKSHLTSAGIEQIKKTIADLPKFFPHLVGYTVYGVITAVHVTDHMRQEVLKEGLYLAQISDETFRLRVPRNFKPHAFAPTAKSVNGHRAKKTKLKRNDSTTTKE